MAGIGDEWDDPVDAILKLVGKYKRSGSGYSFRCPAHQDQRNSAGLYRDKSGHAVIKCYSGCSTESICAALGIEKKDLFRRSNFNGSRSGNGIKAAYKYFDESGQLLYEHLRMDATRDNPKPFYYRRSDEAGNYLWTLGAGWFELDAKKKRWKRSKDAKGRDCVDPANKPNNSARWFDESPRVLYKLVQLKRAPRGSFVIYDEGEKDQETAERNGFLATTGGAAGDWRPEFATDLAPFHVVIPPDNDDAGRASTRKIARDCHGKVLSVRIIELPGLQKNEDLSDWFDKYGGTKEKLLELIHAMPEYVPPDDELTEAEAGLVCEGDDPPISTDPRREKYLRQVLRNAAKIHDATNLLMNKLGYRDDNGRLLRLRTALNTIAPDRLCAILAQHKWVAEKYPGGGMSVSTVARDVHEWEAEDKRLGIDLLGYTPGTYNPVAEHGYASKFARHYLRYTMEAISRAIDIKGDDEYSFQALDRACTEVAAKIPRIEQLAQVESDDSEARLDSDADSAELRAELDPEAEKRRARDKAKSRIAKVMKASIMEMIEAGLTREDIADAVEDEYLNVMGWAASEIERREAGPKKEADDYYKHDPLITTNIIVSTEEREPDSAPPYSRQNDEDIARARVASEVPHLSAEGISLADEEFFDSAEAF